MKTRLLTVTCLILAVGMAICLAHIWQEQKSYAHFKNREIAWFWKAMNEGPGMIDFAQVNIRKTPDGLAFDRGYSSKQIPYDQMKTYVGSLQKIGIHSVVVYTDPEITVGQLMDTANLLRDHGIDNLFINGLFECVTRGPRPKLVE